MKGCYMNKVFEAGKCRCGSEDLEYGSMKIQDEMVFYPFTCNECGADGKEWYHLEYNETTTDEL